MLPDKLDGRSPHGTGGPEHAHEVPLVSHVCGGGQTPSEQKLAPAPIPQRMSVDVDGHVEALVVVVVVVVVAEGSRATRSATSSSILASTSAASPGVAQPPAASIRAHFEVNLASAVALQAGSAAPPARTPRAAQRSLALALVPAVRSLWAEQRAPGSNPAAGTARQTVTMAIDTSRSARMAEPCPRSQCLSRLF